MFEALQVLTIVLVAVGMALSLAHALELPGKLRLDRDTYLAVQTIYYPGFTLGGFAEVGGLPATIVLLALTPSGSAAFWLTLVALAAQVVMHGVFWVVTQPVNKVWLKDQQLKGASASFFGTDRGGTSAGPDQNWKTLRDRWEYSHVVRAILAMVAFIALATAATLPEHPAP
jgi:hypothetical protein